MGQLAGRNQNQQTTLAGTSQSLFMDPCADCGVPVTMVGVRKPDVMRCPACAARAAQASGDPAAD
jgi:hypothetical protein